jgi:hypothetical protein
MRYYELIVDLSSMMANAATDSDWWVSAVCSNRNVNFK